MDQRPKYNSQNFETIILCFYEDTEIGKSFLNRTPIVQEIRGRIYKWDYTKISSFLQHRKQ
jgi:hypothetical protein